MNRAPIAGVAAALLLTTSGLSQDWPQWRGQNRDGVARGVKVPAKWPKALKEEWKVTVGEGFASPVVVGDRVFISETYGPGSALLKVKPGAC